MAKRVGKGKGKPGGNALDDYVLMESMDGQHWSQIHSGNDPKPLHSLAERLLAAYADRRYRIVRKDGTIAWRGGLGEVSSTGTWVAGEWYERHGRHES